MEKVIENLKKNNINVITCTTKEEIPAIVEGMLFDGAKIAAGGSVSVKECGVWDIINKPNYQFFDRGRPGITPEEQQQVFKEVIGCDFYFCSANAVTENGELLNVDGLANRISSIAFGPKRVVMIVGVNKIVPNIKDAFLRVKKIAAPKNCVRLNKNTPCAKLGHCVSLLNNDNPDFADGCACDDRICCDYMISATQRQKNRIIVILVNEDLGY